ncbi:MAG: SCO family protein [Pseudomonadota bacterium]
MRGLVLTAVAATLIGAGAAGALIYKPDLAKQATQVMTSGKALIGGPFELVTHDGKTVTDADFRGKPLLVFFGFTHCPDICPAGLQVMAEAMETLGDKADDVQPVFISVDPERDTPELMASYVSAFHPSLIGLTGSNAQVQAAIKAYRVYARKVALDGSETEYTVDHSAFVYLMDKNGDFVRHFNHGIKPAALAAGLREHLAS